MAARVVMDPLRSRLIRLAHARPELRGALLPLLKEAAPFLRPKNFPVPPPAPNPYADIGREVGGGHGQEFMASPILSPEGVGQTSNGRFRLWLNQAWAVETDATTEEAARTAGRRIQRALKGARTLPHDVPRVHHLPLYVIYGNAYVVLPPAAPREKTP